MSHTILTHWGLLGLLGSLCLFRWLKGVPYSLTNHARPIAKVEDWDLNANNGWMFWLPDHYYWISNNHYLFFRKSRSTIWQVMSYDVSTGTQTLLPQLSRVINENGGMLDPIAVSPNAKMVLWQTLSNRICSASIDGSQLHIQSCRVKSSEHWTEKIMWLPESRYWVEFTGSRSVETVSHALLHDAIRPSCIKSVSIRAACCLGDQNALVTTTGDILSLVTDAHIGHVTVFKTGFAPDSTPPRRYSISLPAETQLEYLRFSPLGDRIVWKLRTTRRKGYWLLVKRFLPFLTGPSDQQCSLWLSRLDGTEMHELGYVDKIPATNDPVARVGGWSEPYEISWTPDGKNLNFICQNELWELPVD